MRDHWPLLLMWGFVAAGLFVYCWSDPRLDDLAGWIPALVFLQLPGFPLAAHPAVAPPEQLPRSWTILFAISLGIVTGFAVFFFCAIAGFWVFRREFEFRPIALGFILGLGVAIFTAVRHGLRLLRSPHPDGIRRAFLELFLIEVAVLAAALYEIGLSLSLDTADKLILVILPLLWMAPLWVLLPPRASSEPPRAVFL